MRYLTIMSLNKQNSLNAAFNIKVIVCDLDGTLLNSEKNISSATVDAVRAAQERGIFVTICTGRIPEMMEAYSRLLKIEGLFIAANGAVLVDAQSGDMPCRCCASHAPVIKLLEYCAERNLDHVAAAVDGCYYSRNSRRIKRFEQYNEIAARENLRQIPLFPLDEKDALPETREIYKVLVSGLSNRQLEETAAYIESLHELSWTSSEAGMLDIGAVGVNKGSGVENLARLMGFNKEEMCVFGDYLNDIPMFEAAGFSIAMGNADEAVKNRASAVTLTNDEDGVAQAIKTYILDR
jgi:Cof subfamily protein (haloacid dehalogenase superfamily)